MKIFSLGMFILSVYLGVSDAHHGSFWTIVDIAMMFIWWRNYNIYK